MRKLAVGFVGLLIFLGTLAAPRVIDLAVKRARGGPLHTFRLRDQPDFLSDETALECASLAMSLDGLERAEWKPSEDDRTEAPDGTPDRYLVRNALDPNRGFVQFVRPDGATRQVFVQFQDGRVECQVWRPK